MDGNSLIVVATHEFHFLLSLRLLLTLGTTPPAAAVVTSPTTLGTTAAACVAPLKFAIAVAAAPCLRHAALLELGRPDFLVAALVIGDLVPILLLLDFYLIQSFQSLFILVFVPFH